MVLTPADAGVVKRQQLKPFIEWLRQDVWAEEGEQVLAPLGLTETICGRLVSMHAGKWWPANIPKEGLPPLSEDV